MQFPNKHAEEEEGLSHEVETMVKGLGIKGVQMPLSSRIGRTSDGKRNSKKKFANEKTSIPKPLNIQNIPPRKVTIVKPGIKWFENKVLKDVSDNADERPSKVTELQNLATQLLEADIKVYELQQNKGRKRAEMTWIRTAIKSGTLSDKIAALTLLIQDSPVHNLSSLETMIGMVKTKKKRECLLAIDSLKELFLSDLLIPDKKLKNFPQNPINNVESLCSRNLEMVHRHLLLWHFEEELKKHYQNFIVALEAMTFDSIETTKQKALGAMHELLSSNPEQEQPNLIQDLQEILDRFAAESCNAGMKISMAKSQALVLLRKLAQCHLQVSGCLLDQVEKFKYLRVEFTNDGKSEVELNTKIEKAGAVMQNKNNKNIFVAGPPQDVPKNSKFVFLLTKLVNKLGDPLHRIAARASRYLTLLIQKHPEMNSVVINEVEYMLYRPNIAAKAQYYAICFLNQIIFDEEDSDLASKLINLYFGFFKLCHKKGEVDSKMMSALLTGINRAFPFVKGEIESLNEQMDAMYKIVHTVNVNISIQALMLLFQVMDARDSLSDRYYIALYRKLQDPDLKLCSRQPMLLNLLYKSLKKDVSEKRIKAFIRRILQICKYFSPPLVCGALFLISELLKSKSGLLVFQQDNVDVQNSEVNDDKTDSDEESVDKGVPVSSWVHRDIRPSKTSYDPSQRNPLYAGAECGITWELQMLACHYHPSVCLFAKSLLDSKPITYDGDPLQDFTLIRFLDRFVFRNPKKITSSTTNETKSRSVFCKRLLKQLPVAKTIPVDSKEYVAQSEDNVAIDEKFLYKYFSQRAKEREAMGLGDSDNDSVTSDQFQDYLASMEPGMKKDLFDMDFAFEFAKQKKKDKKEDDELSDEEIEFDDGEMDDAFKDYDDLMNDEDKEVDFDEEEMEFDDEDFPSPESDDEGHSIDDDSDNEEIQPIVPKKKKKQSKFNSSSLFASAEEFAHMMDDNAASKLNTIGTEALANKDNADVKQLKWEMKRDQQLRGQDWRQKKQRKGPGKRTAQMSKNKFKNKKMRKK